MRAAALSLGLCLLFAAPLAGAATPLADVTSSADQLLSLGGGALLVGPEQAVSEDPPGASNTVELGALPASVDVDALHLDLNGLAFFSLDQPADLGGTFVEPGDVVSYDLDAESYVVVFDASARGLGAGVNVDAVGRSGSDLLLSFDTVVVLEGTTVWPEDVVQWSSSPSAVVVFDGDGEGLSSGSDVDALHRLSSGHLLLSLDQPESLGGSLGEPADAFEYESTGPSFELAIDGSAMDLAWAGAIGRNALHAVEPGSDLCPGVGNGRQGNVDGDGLGDLCDPDIDGDGLANDVETDSGVFIDENDTGTDPRSADTDSDTLSDSEEVGIGSNPNDPDTDSDADLDGVDNCIFIFNPGQEESDVFPGGDVCQCGNVDEIGGVTAADLEEARRFVVGASPQTSFEERRCNVIGPSDGGATDCTVADLFVLARSLGDGSPIPNECDAYRSPGATE